MSDRYLLVKTLEKNRTSLISKNRAKIIINLRFIIILLNLLNLKIISL